MSGPNNTKFAEDVQASYRASEI